MARRTKRGTDLRLVRRLREALSALLTCGIAQVGPAMLAVLAICSPALANDRDADEVASIEASIVAELHELGLAAEEVLFPRRLDTDMRRWVRQHVDPDKAPKRQVQQLLKALFAGDGFALRYDEDHSGTVSEVFATREANCLAFVQLFVALAREVGLPAYYLGVERERSFHKQGDLVIIWEHVTAGYGDGRDRLILDFTPGPAVDNEPVGRLGELTALAMFYSNRGAEALRARDESAALEWLDLAVRLDPKWANAWLNLGVARRRGGNLSGAEQAYRHAIEIDPDNVQAFSNLAVLLRMRGEADAAGEVLALLDRRENRDPFIYLELGHESLEGDRLEDARRFFRKAYYLDPQQADTQAGLGLLAQASGRFVRARRWLDKAQQLDPESYRVDQLRNALDRKPSQELATLATIVE